MSKVVAIIDASNTTTNPTSKLLADIAGKPVLWRVVSRVQTARTLKKRVVVSIASGNEGRVLAEFCRSNGFHYHKAAANADPLTRCYKAAKKWGATEVVLLPPDCPLIDPELIDRAVETLLWSASGFADRRGHDYVTNANPPTFPRGLDVEVITFAALERALQEAKSPFERNDVTLYVRKHGEKFRLCNIANDESLAHLQWKLENPSDLAFVRAVYAEMGRAHFGMGAVLLLLNPRPELARLHERKAVREEVPSMAQRAILAGVADCIRSCEEQLNHLLVSIGQAPSPDDLRNEFEKFWKSVTQVRRAVQKYSVGDASGSVSIKSARPEHSWE